MVLWLKSLSNFCSHLKGLMIEFQHFPSSPIRIMWHSDFIVGKTICFLILYSSKIIFGDRLARLWTTWLQKSLSLSLVVSILER
jgi:hypothetical protein